MFMMMNNKKQKKQTAIQRRGKSNRKTKGRQKLWKRRRLSKTPTTRPLKKTTMA